MPDTRSTYDIAAPQIAEYVQPLEPGSTAMPFSVRDEDGRVLGLSDDHLSGKFLLLVFINDRSDRNATSMLKALQAARDDFDKYNASVIVFNANGDASSNRAMKREARFSWPVAVDSTGAVFASYGLHKGHCVNCRIVLLTPFRQVRGWIDNPEDLEKTMRAIMDILHTSDLVSTEANWSPPHAPVLIVPNVLSRAECAKLIESFETGGPFTVRPPRPGEFHGNYKIPVYEHERQDRVDHIIKDRNILDFLDSRIFSRVTPAIQKAFAFEVTRREDLHIARYAGQRGGHNMGHRDNTSAATSYRRFALSLNLNDDYEGGGVAFKEYSQRAYKSPAGTAIVFSSSLLHEVLETTRGIRYTLISHLFNEQSLPPKTSGI